MPLHDYRCPSMHTTEKLFRNRESCVDTITCHCGQPATRRFPLISRTPGLFGESAGRYDRGLGCYVRNSAERDAVMAARGWVAESDMPNGYADSVIQTGLNEKAEHERNMAKYEYHLKEHKGDAGAAWAETFPAEEILSESDNADAS